MHFAGGHEDHVARLERPVALFAASQTGAGEHEDLVFVVVLVMRRVAVGLDLEVAHVETVGPVFGSDQDAHPRPPCPVHRHGLLPMRLERSYLHDVYLTPRRAS